MTPRTDRERGQVLVLVALVIVLLLGFAALALDGGNIYADRRSAQAAADTAALSGALAVVQGYAPWQVTQVALNRASENNYSSNPPTMNVTVNWPPVAPHPYAGDIRFVQVIITHQLDTIFAHLFYDGPFVHTVEAVAHARVNEDLLPGYAMFADNPSACPGIEFNGNPSTTLTGGGSILSNSSQGCGCSASGAAGISRGSGNVHVVDPLGRAGIFTAGCWKQMGTAFVSVPTPVGGAGSQALNLPPRPDCSGLPDRRSEGDKVFNNAATISPGRYDSISVTANGVLTMQPGIYCLSGNLKHSNPPLTVNTVGSGTIIANNVMIYLESTAGGVDALGTSATTMTAGDPAGAPLPDLIDASGHDWRGMLFYADPANTGELHLSGGSNSVFTGTILAPSSHCDVEGNGGALALNTQLLCDTIQVSGDGTVDIHYDADRNYHQEDGVELFH